MFRVAAVILLALLLLSPGIEAACGAYDSAFFICCKGNLLLKGTKTSCCGSENYDGKFHICCKGNVLLKGNKTSCCGAKNYDGRYYLCCFGRVVRRGGKC